jgi:hypothetical protein
LKVNGHHDRYWVGFADTRVLLVWNGYMQVVTKQRRYDLMIDITKEYTWLGVNGMQAVLRKVKQRFQTTRKGFGSSILDKQ